MVAASDAHHDLQWPDLCTMGLAHHPHELR